MLLLDQIIFVPEMNCTEYLTLLFLELPKTPARGTEETVLLSIPLLLIAHLDDIYFRRDTGNDENF